MQHFPSENYNFQFTNANVPSVMYYTPSAVQYPYFLMNLELQQSLQMQNLMMQNSSYCQPLWPTYQQEEYIPYKLQNSVLKSLHLKTQNGDQSQNVLTQIQNKEICVRAQNEARLEQKAQKFNFTCGNDRFIKKNTESNIVNQIFSFLWSPQKNKSFTKKILIDSYKIGQFNNLMKIVKANCKSQLKRQLLKQLITLNEHSNIFMRLKKKMNKLDSQNCVYIGQAIRKLIFLYLRSINAQSIMTSKKMNIKLWALHFNKCQQIIEYLFNPQS